MTLILIGSHSGDFQGNHALRVLSQDLDWRRVPRFLDLILSSSNAFEDCKIQLVKGPFGLII